MDKILCVQKKYKTETGESMGKPDKKLKRILLIIGITGAVYGVFRYLLPLVVPFLLAWGLALMLRPTSVWLAKRCRMTVNIKGREKVLAVPVGIIGAAELMALVFFLSLALYLGSYKLCMETGMFLEQIPVWVDALDMWLTKMCHLIEDCLCLSPNCLVLIMREMLKGLMDNLKYGAMPYLVANSMTLFQKGMELMVVSVILLVSVGLILQEMDRWKQRCDHSLFRREFALIFCRLAITANAYLKTQGIIMLLTTVICTAGFWILKNPYYILAGISLGVLDALPVFGTGTVLIPWAVIRFFQGKWGAGILMLAIYLACYFLRELLEAKLMGSRVGLSPLETLISMYVGLRLIGILGLILGPVGILLIGDMVKAWESWGRQEEGETGEEQPLKPFP